MLSLKRLKTLALCSMITSLGVVSSIFYNADTSNAATDVRFRDVLFYDDNPVDKGYYEGPVDFNKKLVYIDNGGKYDGNQLHAGDSNYETPTLQEYRYSFDGGKTWIKTKNSFISIENLASTKNTTVTIRSCDITSSQQYTLKIIKAPTMKLNLKYKPSSTSGSTILYTATPLLKNYEVKSTVNSLGGDGSWVKVSLTDLGTLPASSDRGYYSRYTAENDIKYLMTFLEDNGGTFYTRIPSGLQSEAADTYGNITVVRPSSPKTLMIPAKAAAPTVRREAATGLLSGLTNAMEFSIKDMNSNTYYTDLSDGSKTSTVQKWLTTSATSIDLSTIAAVNGDYILVEIRFAVSNGKQASKITELCINQETYTADVVFDYKLENILTNNVYDQKYNYEYAIVDGLTKTPPAKTKWIKFTASRSNMLSLTSKINNLKKDSTLLIRACGNVSEVNFSQVEAPFSFKTLTLPSTPKSFALTKRPEFTATDLATIDFEQETLSIGAATGTCISITSLAEKNSTTKQDVVTFASISSHITVPVISVAAINNPLYKQTRYSYRIEPVIATTSTGSVDFDGRVASLPKTISIPRRTSAPLETNVKFNSAGNLMLPANTEYTTNTAIGWSSSPATRNTFGNSAFTLYVRKTASNLQKNFSSFILEILVPGVINPPN